MRRPPATGPTERPVRAAAAASAIVVRIKSANFHKEIVIMRPRTLAERLTVQLAPPPDLERGHRRRLRRVLGQGVDRRVAQRWRHAHRARVSGLLVWQHVADALVAAAAIGRLPEGWAVLTSDKQHNSGRYLVRFPGGLLTIRRAPHDEKGEGQFMQESFTEMTEELDKLAVPDEQEAARVWLKIAPNGGSLSPPRIATDIRSRSRSSTCSRPARRRIPDPGDARHDAGHLSPALRRAVRRAVSDLSAQFQDAPTRARAASDHSDRAGAPDGHPPGAPEPD